MISTVILTTFVVAFLLANIDIVYEFFDICLQFPLLINTLYESVSGIQGIFGDIIFFGYVSLVIAILSFIIKRLYDIFEGTGI